MEVGVGEGETGRGCGDVQVTRGRRVPEDVKEG